MLAAGEAVFAERGFHEATVDEIARRVGVTRQMVFAYFRSKEQLFMTIYRSDAEELARRVDEAASREEAPDQRLWEAVRAFFAFVDERRDAWSIVYGTGGRQAPPRLAETTAIRARIVGRVAEMFAEALPRGAGAPGDELEPAAAATVATAEALASWWLDHPSEPREAMERRLMNLVWMGLGDLIENRFWTPGADG